MLTRENGELADLPLLVSAVPMWGRHDPIGAGTFSRVLTVEPIDEHTATQRINSLLVVEAALTRRAA